ncbi:MAG: carbohydrate ABC transporter permease [Chloroflexi bacterium]|nr:carbohydrate ABC transporter permease [Chloroflexota bacterium]
MGTSQHVNPIDSTPSYVPSAPRRTPRSTAFGLLGGLRYAVLLLFVVLFLGPLLWIVFLSLKTKQEFAMNPLGLPIQPQWDNFLLAWDQGRFSVYLPNTVIYAAVIVIGICLLACMAGYAFAKGQFPGRDLMFALFLFGMTLPFLSIMIPIFYIARDLQILGTRWGYIIPAIGIGMPFSTFLMRAFFKGIPDELGDAARVDGCTEWGVFWRVMVPLALPGLATVAVFEFLGTWSAYLMPLILVQREELRPVALALPLFQSRYTSELQLIAAATLITIVPPLLIYLFLQRRFIEGVTAGALK